ncbi:MAG: carbon-nitrogen hydrolase family protein [Thermoplasmatota archaeon]
MAPKFRAALVQARPALGDVKANLAQIVDALQRETADLVVFPEMFLSGYLVRDEVNRVAQSLDGPVVAELVAACRATGKHVVFGMPRKGEARGVVHNCAVLLGPSGLVGHYDKVYLPSFSVFEEDLYFREGAALPVFDTPLGKLGLCICYDLFFPEVTKTLALKGADTIVCISASPSISRTAFERVFPARAIETTSWLLYTNLAGLQDTLTFWGAAQAYDPMGHRVAMGPPDEPAVTHVDVDLALVEEARRKRPALRDTRASVVREFYEAALK